MIPSPHSPSTQDGTGHALSTSPPPPVEPARPGLGRRGLLLGAGAASTILTAAACSGGQSVGGSDKASVAVSEPFTAGYDGPDVTITFWNGFTGGDGPYMKQLVEEFTAENPKITVKQSSLEWPDFYSKVVTATDAGSGPEVAAMHLDQLASFASRGDHCPAGQSCRGLGPH